MYLFLLTHTDIIYIYICIHVIILCVLVCIRKLYISMFGSFELYCPSNATGFVFPGKEISQGLVSKQEIVNDVRRRRKWGDIPPPYPNGWFALLRSKELKPGGSTSVNAMGQNFAIFRNKEGDVYIVDAYCPHLGANLGVGGQVQLYLKQLLNFNYCVYPLLAVVSKKKTTTRKTSLCHSSFLHNYYYFFSLELIVLVLVSLL